MTNAPRPQLHAVSSGARLAPDARTQADVLLALERWLTEVVAAGADVVHVRERLAPAGLLVSMVRRVVRSAGTSPTRVVVSDRVDVAMAAEADGVHLPSSGLEAGEVRAWWPKATIGRSVHEGDAAESAAACDYVIFGTVFATTSKPGQAPVGLDGVRRSVGRWECPVVAIGGVTPANAAAVLTAGAAGAAAIGAFLPVGSEPGALGAVEAVRAFRRAWGAVD